MKMSGEIRSALCEVIDRNTLYTNSNGELVVTAPGMHREPDTIPGFAPPECPLKSPGGSTSRKNPAQFAICSECQFGSFTLAEVAAEVS